MTLVLICTALICVSAWVHVRTRDAYRAVGFNDGRIHERELMLDKIRRSTRLEACNAHSAASAVEFLSVKADSVYLQATDGEHLRFCR
ncbi:hypothetical protein ASE08_10305 [Rhizobacter sp. Root16D2]|nr:hypothetical protein ASC88_02135 [Rhizobacter sp. Root29]KQV97272.1 hypothetical protein ASC98_11670 [Rhizobacter sp. Root1238]KRB09944.1 hypothetical protein ASE08_10305 [Rhizobacter sp. Root16D2]